MLTTMLWPMRLALADALHFRRVQGIDFGSALTLILRQHAPGEAQRPGEDFFELGIAVDAAMPESPIAFFFPAGHSLLMVSSRVVLACTRSRMISRECIPLRHRGGAAASHSFLAHLVGLSRSPGGRSIDVIKTFRRARQTGVFERRK